MSYILDALRKADAERDRGNVPGIHAQPSFGGAVPTRVQADAKPWLWLAAGGAAVLVVGALAWFLIGPSRTASEAALQTTTQIAVAPPVPVPATATAPVAPPMPAQAVQPVAPRVETPAPAARKPKPVTVAPSAATAAPAAPATPAPLVAEAKPSASGEKVYTLAELPDDIRRQLPNVSVGGSMYSSKPADRILIINGQVLHEGDRITPDLTLLQVRVKAAVLSFKGYRYSLNF